MYLSTLPHDAGSILTKDNYLYATHFPDSGCSMCQLILCLLSPPDRTYFEKRHHNQNGKDLREGHDHNQNG